jgi:glycosyltransferase involved in cell wall biosynthesis
VAANGGGNHPAVSICIPVYDTERYVAAALDSALNQTLKNIEIICVDDGSTDGSLAILKSYEAKYPQIISVLENGENRGLIYSRLKAILAAKGEYILWLDSDDRMFPETAKLTYAAATAHDVDVVVFSAIFSNGTNLGPWPPKPKKSRAVSACTTSPLAMLASGKIPAQVWNKLWKTELLVKMAQKVMPFAAANNITQNEDNFFCWMVLRDAKKCVNLDYDGLQYFCNTGLAAKKRHDKDYARRWVDCVTKYSKFVLENEDDPQIRNVYANWHLTGSGRLIDTFKSLPTEEGVRAFTAYVNVYPKELQGIVCSTMKRHGGSAYTKAFETGNSREASRSHRTSARGR